MDGIESKVFGIGLESYTVGSHEFCMGYVMSKGVDHIIMTLDTGHYHPTEVVSAKLGGVYAFSNNVLLHVSRPVRWDSDHVVAYDDETKSIMEELVRLGKVQDTYIATDFFDASINRIAAWVIGLRNTRLAMVQEYKAGAMANLVWDYYCAQKGAGVGLEWLDEVKKYEEEVLSKR